VGRLDENACAIAGVRFAAAGAPVVEVQQDLHGLLNNGMRLLAFDIDHETNAARFVLKLWIVKALFGRWPTAPRLFPIILNGSSARHLLEIRISGLIKLKF
jgi:hypothetical protein